MICAQPPLLEALRSTPRRMRAGMRPPAVKRKTVCPVVLGACPRPAGSCSWLRGRGRRLAATNQISPRGSPPEIAISMSGWPKPDCWSCGKDCQQLAWTASYETCIFAGASPPPWAAPCAPADGSAISTIAAGAALNQNLEGCAALLAGERATSSVVGQSRREGPGGGCLSGGVAAGARRQPGPAERNNEGPDGPRPLWSRVSLHWCFQGGFGVRLAQGGIPLREGGAAHPRSRSTAI